MTTPDISWAYRSFPKAHLTGLSARTTPHQSRQRRNATRITRPDHTRTDRTTIIPDLGQPRRAPTRTLQASSDTNLPCLAHTYLKERNIAGPNQGQPDRSRRCHTYAEPGSQIENMKLHDLKSSVRWPEVAQTYQSSSLPDDFVEQCGFNVFGQVALQLNRHSPTGFHRWPGARDSIALDDDPPFVLVVPILHAEAGEWSKTHNSGFEQVHGGLSGRPGILSELRCPDDSHSKIFSRQGQFPLRVAIDIGFKVIRLLGRAAFLCFGLFFNRFAIPAVKKNIRRALDCAFNYVGDTFLDSRLCAISGNSTANFTDFQCCCFDRNLSTPNPAQPERNTFDPGTAQPDKARPVASLSGSPSGESMRRNEQSVDMISSGTKQISLSLELESGEEKTRSSGASILIGMNLSTHYFLHNPEGWVDGDEDEDHDETDD